MNATSVSAAAGREQFLQLLVTQLQYQDPIEPVKQEEFIQQLAQFSTLEGIEKLNANFEQLLMLSELTQTAALIGKTASFRDEPTGATQAARVDEVKMVDGKVMLVADGQEISINSLIGIRGA